MATFAFVAAARTRRLNCLMLNPATQSSSKATPLISRTRLFIMAILLVLVVALMISLQRKGAELASQASHQHPATLEDQTYRHSDFRFSIQAPNRDWVITEIAPTEAQASPEIVRDIIANTTNVVQLTRQLQDTVLARCTVGVFNLKDLYSAFAVAAESLHEIMNQYQSSQDTVQVIWPVTKLETSVADGAIFIVKIPRAATPLEVWVSTYLIKDRVAYAIFCQTSEAAYPAYRDDIEKIIGSFRLL